MDVPADVGMGGHGIEYLVADVLGMRGGKPYAKVRRHGGHALQQAGEVHGFPGAFPQVAVYVLPQQGDFPVTAGIHVAGFPHDGMGVAGTLRPAGIGHYAVGTDVVAPAHDGDEGGDAVFVRANGSNVGVGLFPGEQHVHLRAVRAYGFQQAGKGAVGVGAHYQVHLPGFQKFVFQALGHAAHDADKQAGTVFPELVEHFHAAPDALLCVIPDAAGVGHHEVCLLHHFRAGVACL